MLNIFKRGLTLDEAVLIASNLANYNTLKIAKNHLQRYNPIIDGAEVELTNPYNDEGLTSGGIGWDEIETHKAELERLQLAENLYEALIDEARIACQWHDYHSGEAEFYETSPEQRPLNDTYLELFQIFRYGPDIPEISFVPDLDKTMFTKVSFAKWFEAHLPDKAPLFDPSESYKSIETGYSRAQVNKKENRDALTVTTSPQTYFSDQITNTEAWKNLYKLTEKAVEDFPDWQQNQPKPHKIQKEQIRDWLINTVKMSTREAEFVKKVLDEIFNL